MLLIAIVGCNLGLMIFLVIGAVMDFAWQYYDYELLHGRLFIVTSVLTWFVCLFTYSLIERPFLLKKYQR